MPFSSGNSLHLSLFASTSCRRSFCPLSSVNALTNFGISALISASNNQKRPPGKRGSVTFFRTGITRSFPVRPRNLRNSIQLAGCCVRDLARSEGCAKRARGGKKREIFESASYANIYFVFISLTLKTTRTMIAELTGRNPDVIIRIMLTGSIKIMTRQGALHFSKRQRLLNRYVNPTLKAPEFAYNGYRDCLYQIMEYVPFFFFTILYAVFHYCNIFFPFEKVLGVLKYILINTYQIKIKIQPKKVLDKYIY
ncbi:hypothetical protein PUN28_017524 [Cardiocondyla obscurior]|uniref:Uncharacterized protein n=1 Tax=Cardiocondyla obscurior TaxID=286306 RepID=A0AAW2EK42_9HYME